MGRIEKEEEGEGFEINRIINNSFVFQND